ncbi:MAG: DUF3179 domain-containing protein [Actinobacteria bacterium]|nr:DUF3179 domain-containing protein [Actinomycetota bacterium]
MLRLLTALLVVGLAAVTGAGTAMSAERPPATLGLDWKTNFSKRLVPFSEFQSGGPGKGGIPAIDRPRFAPIDQIDFLKPEEPVIELEIGGQARAYPLQILIWHEIVNDTFGGIPIAVTFCPLCNTAIVFDRRVKGRTLTFGVSGNLRNSDLVMYDRQTESWWQQFGGDALVGDLAGTKLRQLAARIVSWRDFRAAHPDGRVLTRDTGHTRRYGDNPYVGYDDISSPPFFPTKNRDDTRLPPKERVVFLESGGKAAVVPHSALARKRVIEVRLDGKTYVVRATGKVASALDSGSIADGRSLTAVEVRVVGKRVPFDQRFWFAVAAFRPDATIVR